MNEKEKMRQAFEAGYYDGWQDYNPESNYIRDMEMRWKEFHDAYLKQQEDLKHVAKMAANDAGTSTTGRPTRDG